MDEIQSTTISISIASALPRASPAPSTPPCWPRCSTLAGFRSGLRLRINPCAPYNALNYGLGLSSCTFRAYLQGMVGAFPYTCVAVYAGMIISSVDDINSLFTYTSTAWYCVYAAFAVACVLSCIAIVRYTSAEMKAAVRLAPAQGGDGDGIDGGHGVDHEGDFGDLPPDSTMFGTFTSRAGDDGSGEGGRNGRGGMGTFDEIAVAREPLLGGPDSRSKHSPVAGRPVQGSKGMASSVVNV